MIKGLVFSPLYFGHIRITKKAQRGIEVLYYQTSKV